MRKPRGPLKTKAGKVSQQAMDRMDSTFEEILRLLETAVSAGLIAGVNPESFLAVLSYQFLLCASNTRGTPSPVLEHWVSNPAIVWEPIVESAIDLAERYPELDEMGAFEDLRFLREECNVGPCELSEIESHRHSNNAVRIVGMVLNELAGISDLPSLVVEMSLLVVWFKVAALSLEIEDEHYVTMRVIVPLVHDAYSEILRKGHIQAT